MNAPDWIPLVDPTRLAAIAAKREESPREPDRAAPDSWPRFVRVDPTPIADLTPAEAEHDRPEPADSTARKAADPTERRDLVVDAGLTIAAFAAIASSFTALRGLAHLVGWSPDWLLPITLDVYAITGTRVWMSRRTKSRKVRTFATVNAVGAIILSLVGNAAYHAIHAGAWHVGHYFWVLIVVVSSIPPVAIGLISHLAVLRGRDAEFAADEAAQVDQPAPVEAVAPAESVPVAAPIESPDPIPVPDPTPAIEQPPTPRPTESTPRPRPAQKPTPVESPDPDPDLDADLLKRATALAAAHHARTGRPIGADPIRTALGVGSKRARQLRDAVHGIHSVDSTEAVG